MPARRPYASRGLPRRATSPRSGASQGQGRIVLAGVLILLAACGAWALGALRNGGTLVADADSSQSRAAIGSPTAVPINQQSAPPTRSTQTQTPAVAMLHEWDARAPGIVNDPALIARLDSAFAGVDGHIGIAVKDLGSGRGAVLGGDLELQSASLYKLPVLYSVFASGLRLGELLPITQDALSYDAGTIELGPGETLSVGEALERMVTLSDNTSAVMLSSRVGSARINSNIAALGMDTTHYSLERMTTSALDMLRLIERVAEGDAVSTSASAEMVHLLLRQRVNDRLPRLLPIEARVAHKTGNLPGIVNDAGIIYGPSSTVAVVALVSDTPDETAAATGIARLAQAAYAYFEDQPESSDRPTLPPAPARPIPPAWREPRPVVIPTLAPPDAPSPIPSGADEPTATAPPAAAQATSATAPTATPIIAQPTVRPTETPTPVPPARTATPVPPPSTSTAPPQPTQPTAKTVARGFTPAPATPTPGKH